MIRQVRAVSLAIACFVAFGGGAARAATKAAPVRATVLKPLTLVSIQNLDLGTLILRPGTWALTTVGISRAGVFSCPGTNISCIGPAQVAVYNVTGSNSRPVRISAPNVTLTNQSDGTKTLILTVDSPGTVTLPNSGNKGVNFPLGGSVSLSSSTATGVYVGTFAVTVDYQ